MSPYRTVRALCRFGFLLALVLLGGCSTAYLFSDSDPSIDRTRYRTYSWSKAEEDDAAGDPAITPFIYGRIHSALQRELSVRGYELKKNGPVDFTVKVQVARVIASSIYQGSLYYPRFYSRSFHRGHLFAFDPWRGGPFGATPTVIYHEEGYLVIDVVDSQSGKPAWRGSLLLPVRPESEGSQREIDRSVKEIVERFSPVKNGK